MVVAAVALPPDEAFRVFTAEIGSWYVVDRYTVVDHERTVDVRIEPGVGGRIMDVHDDATGEGHEMGRITAWEPPSRFEFTDARATETEVRFDPLAGGARTVVTLEQRGLDDVDAQHARVVTSGSGPRLRRRPRRPPRDPVLGTDGPRGGRRQAG